MRVLIVVNDAGFFLSHRLPIALALLQKGHDVHVATPPGPSAEVVKQHGLEHHAIRLNRGSRNPLSELMTFASILSLLRRLRPDLVHLVTIKAVLYGGLAARLARIPGVVAAVPGLGFTFLAEGRVAEYLRKLVVLGYRSAFRHQNLRAVFQNETDLRLFTTYRIVTEQQTILVRGSGVDLEQFAPRSRPVQPPIVMFAGRLLWDKGVGEFVEAARRLGDEASDARFVLVGDMDPHNPRSIPADQVARWQAEGTVEWWGFRRDMANALEQASVVVLPSYREGLPKVLLEAAACGRPVITTDVPGCRDAIEEGATGVLVPERDAHALAAAIRKLLINPELREEMGTAGRCLAVRDFSIHRIVEQHMKIYDSLLEACHRPTS